MSTTDNKPNFHYWPLTKVHYWSLSNVHYCLPTTAPLKSPNLLADFKMDTLFALQGKLLLNFGKKCTILPQTKEYCITTGSISKNYR